MLDSNRAWLVLDGETIWEISMLGAWVQISDLLNGADEGEVKHYWPVLLFE